jgi:hypothetical protein
MSAVTAERLTSRVPTLLRDTGFRRYWSAQSISMFGDQISSVACRWPPCSRCGPGRPRWAT